MQAFTRHQGIAAALLRDNIDTDAIIPSREMNRVSRRGLGRSLFAGWRYLPGDAREPDPDFVLNSPRGQEASILLAGSNFGCGSSREHAVWALDDFGIRAVIAVSFGAIFEANCWRNGVLPVTLPRPVIEQLTALAQGNELLIDLEACSVSVAAAHSWPFEAPPRERQNLLEGSDAIDQALRYREDIDAATVRRSTTMPWAVLPPGRLV